MLLLVLYLAPPEFPGVLLPLLLYVGWHVPSVLGAAADAWYLRAYRRKYQRLIAVRRRPAATGVRIEATVEGAERPAPAKHTAPTRESGDATPARSARVGR